ncbi:hypothetical protein L2E82_01641 [Cichorium intybus]|uniref:Uncharacterized protein n=1 Tax=Cichorium intybus TaxID=13427 RepID=A0ACB9H1L8_CICIN|nr:hypothetical protein L2E82_01641 [Cichorium intybus]
MSPTRVLIGFILLAIFGMLTGAYELSRVSNYQGIYNLSKAFQRFPPSDFSNFSGKLNIFPDSRNEGLILSIRGHGRPYVVILESGKEYNELMNEFMTAVKQNYGEKVLIQFETISVLKLLLNNNIKRKFSFGSYRVSKAIVSYYSVKIEASNYNGEYTEGW